jgi:hypothetical protein
MEHLMYAVCLAQLLLPILFLSCWMPSTDFMSVLSRAILRRGAASAAAEGTVAVAAASSPFLSIPR